MSRKKLTLFLGLGLALAAGALATSPTHGRWRLQLLSAKLRGNPPHLSWSVLLRRMTPTGGAQAWYNFLRHQVKHVQRAGEPCPALWDTPMGAFWGRNRDGDLLALLMLEQLVESIYQQGPVVIRTGDVVLDVGAHLGTFSRFALSHGARLVVAFEPDPTNVTCFKRTFAPEIAAGRVILVEAALWETPGTLNLTDNGLNSGTGSVLPGSGARVVASVPAVTMDDAVRDLSLPRVDFIKMDIEGAERHALRGGRGTISRFGPRMALCIYHRPDDPIVIQHLALEARPSYHVITGRHQAYFF